LVVAAGDSATFGLPGACFFSLHLFRSLVPSALASNFPPLPQSISPSGRASKLHHTLQTVTEAPQPDAAVNPLRQMAQARRTAASFAPRSLLRSGEATQRFARLSGDFVSQFDCISVSGVGICGPSCTCPTLQIEITSTVNEGTLPSLRSANSLFTTTCDHDAWQPIHFEHQLPQDASIPRGLYNRIGVSAWKGRSGEFVLTWQTAGRPCKSHSSCSSPHVAVDVLAALRAASERAAAMRDCCPDE